MVSVELTELDMFATAGGQAKAFVRATTPNTQGQIVIVFTSVVDQASVSGIEIKEGTVAVVPAPTPVPAGSYAINTGGKATGSFAADNYATGGNVIAVSTLVSTTGVTNAAPAEEE